MVVDANDRKRRGSSTHAQLGRILATHDWNLREAESSYRRALELAPGSSSVLDGSSVLFYKLGRLEEAQNLGEKVLQQDPLSAAYWHNLGLTYHAAGKLPESENAFRRALELAPQRLVSRALLALVLLDNGKRDEAVEQAKEEPDEFWRSWSLAIVFESIGDHGFSFPRFDRWSTGLSRDSDDSERRPRKTLFRCPNRTPCPTCCVVADGARKFQLPGRLQRLQAFQRRQDSDHDRVCDARRSLDTKGHSGQKQCSDRRGKL